MLRIVEAQDYPPPPHTRGSTWDRWVQAAEAGASPAYAGIDLLYIK